MLLITVPFPHLETLWNLTVNPNLVTLNEGLVFPIGVRFFLGELLEIFIVLRHLPAPVL